MGAAAKLTGQRFGKLLVICRAPNDRHNKTYWTCLCDCGRVKVMQTYRILNGQMCRPCGMMRGYKHGEAMAGKQSTEYKTWSNMKTRCFNRNKFSFKDYGGRGITVCDRWKNSFENFLADMGRKPTPKHTLERVNNDGNYEPSNCCWATQKEQRKNQRKSVAIQNYSDAELMEEVWRRTPEYGLSGC